MGYTIVDPATLPAGPGPHPAASPFDKRVSDALGITAFEVYTVELPPHAEMALPPDGGHLVSEDVHHGKTASGVHS